MAVLPFFFALWGMAVTVVWIVIGWRAMTAHERIANAVERIAQKDSLPKA